MLSSSPAFLKCHECKKSPKQFTFLLCNHIICEKCVSKKIEFGEKYNSVICSCGSLTYFNQDSEIVEEEDMKQQSIENDKRLFKVKMGFGTNNERRSMIDQRNSFSNNLSKQTIDQYSKTLINERSTMPMLQVSQVFSLQKNDSSQQNRRYRPSSPQKHRYMNGSLLTSELRHKLTGTDKTKYDQSLLLGDYQSYEFSNKRLQQPTRAINQFSTHQIGADGDRRKDNKSEQIGQVGSNNLLKQVKHIKDSVIVSTTNNNISNSPSSKTKLKQSQLQVNSSALLTPSIKPHHHQFQSQLVFLKIMFQKDVEQIEYQFKKVMDKISKAYQSLQTELRSLYVEQVITKQSIASLNLSDLVRNKYEKTIGQKFRALKDQLFYPFYNDNNNKHNQNHLLVNKIKKEVIESPLLQAYKLNCKMKPQLNNSQVVEDSQDNSQDVQDSCEQITTKNKRVPQFEFLQQKVERMTTKHPRPSRNNRTDHVKLYNQESSKRIQTQNIHTSIKRNQSHSNINQHKQHHKNNNPLHTTFHNNHNYHQTYHHSPQQHCRLTQKPKRTHTINTPQKQHKRRQIIYYSPPIPYCYKHLQKKQKQAKNYISYIEKLCHEKKMKNNQELFKKVKSGNRNEFGRQLVGRD